MPSQFNSQNAIISGEHELTSPEPVVSSPVAEHLKPAHKPTTAPVAYARECASYLSPLGSTLFFAYIRLNPTSRSVQAEWAKKLQSAIFSAHEGIRPKRLSKNGHSLGKNPVISKIQVSNWCKGNFFHDLMIPDSGVPTFVIFPIFFRGPDPLPWAAHLMLVYEKNSKKLYHRFTGVTGNYPLTSDWILYSLGKILNATRGTPIEVNKSWGDYQILFPEKIHSRDVWDEVYQNAYNSIICRAFPPEKNKSLFRWGNYSSEVDLSACSFERYQLSVDKIFEVDFSTSRELEVMLTGIAKRFDPKDPSWFSLNPPKAVKRLDPDRYVNKPG